jgi:hypothetical protein
MTINNDICTQIHEQLDDNPPFVHGSRGEPVTGEAHWQEEQSDGLSNISGPATPQEQQLCDAASVSAKPDAANGPATTTWYEIEGRNVNNWPDDGAWPIGMIPHVKRLGKDGYLYFAPGSRHKSMKRTDNMFPTWELAVAAYFGRIDAMAAKVNAIKNEAEQVLRGTPEAYLHWRRSMYGE